LVVERADWHERLARPVDRATAVQRAPAVNSESRLATLMSVDDLHEGSVSRATLGAIFSLNNTGSSGAFSARVDRQCRVGWRSAVMTFSRRTKSRGCLNYSPVIPQTYYSLFHHQAAVCLPAVWTIPQMSTLIAATLDGMSQSCKKWVYNPRV